jgi:hypothetical protein
MLEASKALSSHAQSFTFLNCLTIKKSVIVSFKLSIREDKAGVLTWMQLP